VNELNEQSARHAIKKLVDDNAIAFMDGILVNGHQRDLAHVAISEAALPSGTGTTDYPFVRVVCRRAYLRRLVSRSALQTLGRYDMEVLVSDEATIQLGDTTPAEQADSDFRLLCDRMVNEIMDTRKFAYSTTNYVLVAEGTDPISKANNDGWIGDTLFLGAVIAFTLEEC